MTKISIESEGNEPVKKYSILMLTGQFLPEVYGGAEQQCNRLVKTLCSNGHTVHILTSRSTFQLPRKEVVAGGATIFRPYTAAPPQKLGRYILSSFWWLTYIVIWAAFNLRKYDIIHVHQCKFQAYVGVILAKLYNIKLIVKIGNAGEYSDLLSLKGKALIGPHLYRTIIRKVDIFVAISSDIKLDLLNFGVSESKISSIPNGIFAPDPDEQNTLINYRPDDCISFIVLGRLERVKNIESFLRSLTLITLSRSVKFNIVGDGSLYQHLVSLSDGLALDNVTFHGYSEDVFNHLKSSHYLLLPSLAEGMSNTLLEAMSVGTVPISTRVSGSQDLITDMENGYFIESSSPAAISKSICLAISKHDNFSKLSDNSKSTILNSYTFSSVTSKYLDLYKELTS
jgi:glycosyltransferase involved in cell wall biosynthesis